MSDKILSQIIPYIKTIVKDYKEVKRGQNISFICPSCKHVHDNRYLSAKFVNRAGLIIKCSHCGFRGDIFDIVKLDKEKKDWDKYKILEHVAERVGLEYSTPKAIKEVFAFYREVGFDLVPVAPKGKNPVESNWTNKSHKGSAEWRGWLENGLNIGCKTGEKSNVTVLDFDSEVPAELEQYRKEALKQKSTKGEHWFFIHEKILPNVKIVDIDCDILNTGKQVVIFPSVTDTSKKEFIGELRINKMPEGLKKYLLQKPEIKNKFDKNISKVEDYSPSIEPDISSLTGVATIGKGNRSNFLISFGGVLIKKLNIEDTCYALDLINKQFCQPPLSYNYVRNQVVAALCKYVGSDDQDLAHKIIDYLRDVGGAPHFEVAGNFGGNINNDMKKKVYKILYDLAKQGSVIKKGRNYSATRKVNWESGLIEGNKPLDFKVPYFHDIAKFNSGDIILIGAATGVGKCISDGYIITRNGMIDIQEYGKNFNDGITYLDNEHLFYGRKKNYFFKAKYFYKEKVKKTIRITTEKGYEIRGTEEHPVFTDRSYRKLENLNKGDYAYISSGNFGSYDIPLLNGFRCELEKNTMRLSQIHLPSLMEENLSKFLGYLVADGNLYKNSITISNSKTYVQKDVVVSLKKYHVNSHVSEKTSIIFSKIFRDFIDHLLGNPEKFTARYKFIPKQVLAGKREIQKAFLEGYLNCDTSYCNNFEISTASKKLAEQVHLLLLNFGIISKRSVKRIKKYDHDYWIISLTRDMSKKLLATFNLSKYKKRNSPIEVETGDRILITDKIVKKELINEEVYVYDFNIPNYHAFWSNGFISHNTNIAMNITQRLVKQGVTPYYIGSEQGSRFKNVALSMGLEDGDFYHTFCSDLLGIELEKEAVSIIDWILPDYKETDKLFQSLADQMYKKRGLLIAFVQLRKNNDWFAKDMIESFPALAVKYIYDENGGGHQGEYASFHVEKIRDAKRKIKNGIIPCRYLWDEKLLITIEEQEKREKEI